MICGDFSHHPRGDLGGCASDGADASVRPSRVMGQLFPDDVADQRSRDGAGDGTAEGSDAGRAAEHCSDQDTGNDDLITSAR